MQLNTTPVAFPLMETVEQVLQQHASLAAHKAVSLHLIRGKGEGIWCLGDYSRFQGTVSMLVSAALTMSNGGEMKIWISAGFVDEKRTLVHVRISAKAPTGKIPRGGVSSVERMPQEGKWRYCFSAGCLLAHAVDTIRGTREHSELSVNPYQGDEMHSAASSENGKNHVSKQLNADPGLLSDMVLTGLHHDARSIETYINLLRVDIEKELQRLQQSMTAKDRANVQAATHGLKGLCGSLRNPVPGEMARKINKCADFVSWEELLHLTEQLRIACLSIAWGGEGGE